MAEGPGACYIREMVPLDYRTPEGRRRRFRPIPVRMLVPNVITLLAICAGLTAIRLSTEGKMEWAVAAIVFAAVLDGVDGRVARMIKGQSKFGAELDSLADFVNFGVTPAILVYTWSLHQLRNLGWIVALGLAICCALRLARFNVAIDDPDKPAWKMNYFVGIPAPAGAGLAMAPMYLGFLGLVPDGRAAAAVVLLWVALVAAGMVSRLPTFSGKTLGQRVHRDLVPPIIAGAVLGLIMLIAFTWEMLSIIALTYAALIPFGIRSYRRQERAFAERVGAPDELPS